MTYKPETDEILIGYCILEGQLEHSKDVMDLRFADYSNLSQQEVKHLATVIARLMPGDNVRVIQFLSFVHPGSRLTP